MWNHLDNQLRKRKLLPHSEKDLIEALQEELANIKLETLHDLILSLPSWINITIKAKERHTRY